MGTSIPMQELIGLRGEQGEDYVPQARTWLDTSDHKELVTDWLILQNTANTGCPVLTLETAVAAEGPWTTIATFGSGYTHAQVYCTSRETGMCAWWMPRNQPQWVANQYLPPMEMVAYYANLQDGLEEEWLWDQTVLDHLCAPYGEEKVFKKLLATQVPSLKEWYKANCVADGTPNENHIGFRTARVWLVLDDALGVRPNSGEASARHYYLGYQSDPSLTTRPMPLDGQADSISPFSWPTVMKYIPQEQEQVLLPVFSEDLQPTGALLSAGDGLGYRDRRYTLYHYWDKHLPWLAAMHEDYLGRLPQFTEEKNPGEDGWDVDGMFLLPEMLPVIGDT